MVYTLQEENFHWYVINICFRERLMIDDIIEIQKSKLANFYFLDVDKSEPGR